MKILKLYFRMLRYRSAMVLVLFLLLGSAWHTNIQNDGLPLLLAAIALVSAYVCATVTNDLADWKIDLINLKGHIDRPLITGEGSRRDLVITGIVAGAIVLGCGLIIGQTTTLALGAIMLWNIAYSLPFLRISYLPILTPFYLVAGYVVWPYIIGVTSVGNRIGAKDLVFLPALCALFLARISLKDFRDREGDAKNHKPTFILKYGKSATCTLSIAGLIVGSLLLAFTLKSNFWLIVCLLPFVGAILLTEARLAKVSDKQIELISIGFGARLGNGMLCTLLGVMILQTSHAPLATQIMYVLIVVTLYAQAFNSFWFHPETFQFGKKSIN